MTMRTWTTASAMFAAAALGGLLAAGEAAAADDEGWSGELAASVTAQTGTTDTFSGSIDATARREWENDVVNGRFSGVYGTSRRRNEDQNDSVIQDAQGIFGDWKHTVHQRFFWNSAAQVSRDLTQDRLARVAADTGPGFRIWEGDKPKKHHFDMNLGVGYRFELYDPDTAAGDPDRGNLDEDHFADIVAGFEYKNLLFEDRVEYTHTAGARMPANDPNSFIVTTEIILGIPLTEAWSFRTAFFAEYVAEQPDEVNNTTTRTTIGLGYKF